jgi:hypothetical protein
VNDVTACGIKAVLVDMRLIAWSDGSGMRWNALRAWWWPCSAHQARVALPAVHLVPYEAVVEAAEGGLVLRVVLHAVRGQPLQPAASASQGRSGGHPLRDDGFRCIAHWQAVSRHAAWAPPQCATNTARSNGWLSMSAASADIQQLVFHPTTAGWYTGSKGSKGGSGHAYAHSRL